MFKIAPFQVQVLKHVESLNVLHFCVSMNGINKRKNSNNDF